jgi:hypothetical protein
MIKLSFADICELMENKYIDQSKGKFTRLDFAMLALYEPEKYDFYVYDFIKEELEKKTLTKNQAGDYYANTSISDSLSTHKLSRAN